MLRRPLLLLCAVMLVSGRVAAQDTGGDLTLAPDAEERWVPFTLTPGNQIRFALTVDGRPLTAILDTGVSVSLIGRTVAAAIAPVEPGGQAKAVGGVVTIGWLPTRALTLGALTRRGGRIGVADLPAAATGEQRPVNVMVGRDLIEGQALDIDYPNRRFRLLPSGRLPFAGATAPLLVSPQRLLYESAIGIDGQRVAPVVIDTGDGASITVTQAGWQRTGMAARPSTTTVAFGLAGPMVSTLAIAPTVSLGELSAHDVEVRAEPGGGFSESIGAAGRIGSGFLQDYRVLLDPGAGRMVLQRGPSAPRPALRSTSGLLTGVLPDRLRVLHVMRGSPAAATGWRPGEEICAVDGAAIGADYARTPGARWSVGVPGRTVTLTTCGGAVRPLTLAAFY